MEWAEILIQLFEIVLIPLIGTLTTFGIVLIKNKAAQIAARTEDETKQKYIDMLAETITKCVAATTQTYVDSLKASGNFNAEAQQEAFQKSFDAVMLVLTNDAKEYLSHIYGDLTAYITQAIEAEVKANKIIPTE